MPNQKISQETEIFELPDTFFFIVAETDTDNDKITIANIFRKADTTTDLNLDANHATPADAQVISNINFIDDSSTAVERTYGQIRTLIQSPTNAAEEGEMFLSVIEGGTLTDYIGLNSAGDNQVNILKDLDMGGNILTNLADITAITLLNGIAIGSYVIGTDDISAISASTTAQFNTALTGDSFFFISQNISDMATSTSAEFDLANSDGTFFLNADNISNMATSTSAQFDTANSDDNFAYEGVSNTWGAVDQNISATGKWQEGGVDISPIGLHDYYVDAGGFIHVDSESLATRIIGATVNQKAIAYIPFTTAVDTFATAKFKLPRTYDLGTMTAVINWMAPSGSGNVVWGISAVAVSDDEAISTAFGTEVVLTADTFTVADDSLDTARSSDITIGNTPADADTIYLKIQRRGADGGDTFTGEAQLLGVWIEITTDTAVSG